MLFNALLELGFISILNLINFLILIKIIILNLLNQVYFFISICLLRSFQISNLMVQIFNFINKYLLVIYRNFLKNIFFLKFLRKSHSIISFLLKPLRKNRDFYLKRTNFVFIGRSKFFIFKNHLFYLIFKFTIQIRLILFSFSLIILFYF